MKLPSFLQIEPVGQCNLRCQMCPIQYRNDGPPRGMPAFLKFDTYLRILEQLPQIEHLHLQGLGEPMMHPRFFEMVSVAAARGIRVTTNTNLTVLSPARAELCVSSGLECIYISIDAASPEVYERIRVGSRMSRVLRNLAFLDDARRTLASSLPRLRLVTVIMRQNLAELPELVRLAHHWKMESMFVQHLCHDFGEATLPPAYLPMRQFVESESLLGESRSSIESSFAAARRTADELGLELRLPQVDRGGFPDTMRGEERCDWPRRGIYISYQGFVMPCCMISTPDRLNFGNVSGNAIDVIWNGESYDEFRRRLASNEPPEVCQACSVYHGLF